MAKRLFVGSLPYTTTESQIREIFEKAGTVDTVNVIPDREAGEGRGKGFAFVDMGSDDEAAKAIQLLNGYKLDGRTLIVNEARPKEDRNRGGGGRRDDQRNDRRGTVYSRDRN